MKSYTDISSESNFFQWLKSWTSSWIYWERIEPSNECGFPDTTALLKSSEKEGAIELKYTDKTHVLANLMRSSQIVSFMDYFNAGGKRRGLIKFVKQDYEIHFYRTQDVVKSMLSKKDVPWKVINLKDHDPILVAAKIRELIGEMI